MLAIVLRSIKSSDRLQIIEFLTEEEGCISYGQRINQMRRGISTRTLFQPLSLLEIDHTTVKEGHLPMLKDVHPIPRISIPYTPPKTTIAFFIAEFLRAALHNDPEASNLFQYVNDAITWLDTTTTNYSNFHLVFLLRLSAYFGFSPNLDHYNPKAFFDLIQGEFVNTQPLHPHYVNAQEARHLPLLLRFNFQTMHLLKISGTQRSYLLELILKYYRLHLPNFPILRTLPVLKEIFNS